MCLPTKFSGEGFNGHAGWFGEQTSELIRFRGLGFGFRCNASGFAVCHWTSFRV